MRLREHVLDLLTGFQIPLRHIMREHILFPRLPQLRVDLFLCNRSLTHSLHNLKGLFRFHALIDQIGHNIVSGTYTGGNRSDSIPDQILRIAHPHVGSMRQTGYPDKVGKGLRLCLDNHVHSEVRAELGDAETAQLRPADLLRRYAERIGILEQTHDIPAVQRNRQRVTSCQILQHTDHRRIIVSENVQLQKVMIDRVIVKVRRYGVRRHIVRRVLHGGKGIDVLPQRQNDDTARMLSGTAAHADTAHDDTVNLTVALVLSSLLIVILHVAERRLIRKRCNRARAEGLPGAEDNLRILMRLRLVLAGEVQVDIRLLVSLESKEGLKGDVKALLVQRFTADRTDLVRHIDSGSSGICLYLVAVKVGIMAFTAIIVRA